MLISKLNSKPDPMIVPVWNFHCISKKYGSYRYSYDMMRLGVLSPDDRIVINQVDKLHSAFGKESFQHLNELSKSAYDTLYTLPTLYGSFNAW